MTSQIPGPLKDQLLAQFSRYDGVQNESFPGLGYVGYAITVEENSVAIEASLTIDPLRALWRWLSGRGNPGELLVYERQTGECFEARGPDVTAAFGACVRADLAQRRERKATAPVEACENLEKLVS